MIRKLFPLLLTLAIFSCVSGCGQKTEYVRRFSTLDFEGYKLPGRIEEAKEMGFQDCKSGYESFECVRKGDSTLIGVKTLSATLRLEYRDYFLDNGSYKADLPPDQRVPEKLTYERISFLLPETQYDGRCVSKRRADLWEKPIECRKDDTGTDYLKHQLLATGWLMNESKMHLYYFKENQLVTIHIDRDGKTVTIKQIPQKERDSEIQSIKQKTSDIQRRQSAQADVLKKLKN